VIDFRYHLVSLTAVFMALAIGIVLGTSALNKPVMQNLRSQVHNLTNDKNKQRDQIGSLRGDLKDRESFAAAVGAVAVAGKLTGQRVAVISLPGADNAQRENVVTLLRAAGANVTARVTVNAKFTDPASGNDLKDQVVRLLPPDVKIPESDDGEAQAAAVLAGVLIDHGTSSVSEPNRTAFLTSLTTLGVIGIDGQVTGGADSAVLVAGAQPTGRDAAKQLDAQLTIVHAVEDRNGRTVLAGPLADGGPDLVGTVRKDQQLGAKVSTVDDLDSADGQCATVLALVEQTTGGHGHYGVGSGARGPIPTQTPTS
jgi:hypothetical protein